MGKNYLTKLFFIKGYVFLVLFLTINLNITAQIVCNPDGSAAQNMSAVTFTNRDANLTITGAGPTPSSLAISDDLTSSTHPNYMRSGYSDQNWSLPLHLEFTHPGSSALGIMIGLVPVGEPETTLDTNSGTGPPGYLYYLNQGSTNYQLRSARTNPGGGGGSSVGEVFEIDILADGTVTWTVNGSLRYTTTGAPTTNYQIVIGNRFFAGSGVVSNTLTDFQIAPLVCVVPTPPIVDLDGDGIDDKVDDDDDNDGVLDSDEIASCNAGAGKATVQFINETFGTGTTKSAMTGLSSSSYTYDAGPNQVDVTTNQNLVDGEYALVHLLRNGNASTFTGANWGANHDDIALWAEDIWTAGEDHTPGDTNGKMAVFNAASSAGIFFTSSIIGVEPSEDLTISFWARNIDLTDNGDTRNKPDITLNFTDESGVTIFTQDTGVLLPEDEGGGWTEFTYTIPSATLMGETAFFINLVNNQLGGAGNDLAIDDITAQQDLCDTDADGIPNHRDIDDDGDGIPTMVELNIPDPNNSGTLFNSGTAWVDGNTDGVHDSYPTGATLVDTDGDLVPDYLDFDSDNDGIFDIVEYDGLGDADITGDGVTDWVDVDQDGLADLYDQDTGAFGAYDGSTGYPDPVDTAPTDTPNYRNTSSNNFSDDIDGTMFTALDADNDGEIDSTTDADEDGIMASFDGNEAVYGSPRDFTTQELYVDFDGRNDYIESPGFLNALGATPTTMMAWIMIEGGSGRREIMGEGDNASMFIHESAGNTYVGYVQNGVTRLCTDIALPTNVWVHVAVAIGWSGEVNVYVNGERDATALPNVSYPINAGENFNIGRKSDGTNYFNGGIDEARVFRTYITEDDLKALVCQKLSQSGSNLIQGEVTTVETAMGWGALAAYYRLDGFQDDVVDDYVTDGVIDITAGAQAYNIHNIQLETTPLPYQTTDYSGVGDWRNWHYGTGNHWLHDDVWEINETTHYSGADIVEIRDNTYLQIDHSLYGLIINTSKLVVVGYFGATPPGHGLTVTGYLRFDSGVVGGILDLWGESQLVQTEGSVFDINSVGGFEVNQEGTANSFAYNYFCLPTSNPTSPSVANEAMTVNDALRTATDTYDPQLVNWCNGYYCADNGTLNVSARWLHTYPPSLQDYDNWFRINQNTPLSFGEGYIMKGPNNAQTADLSVIQQSYTFVGFPNNASGDIVAETLGANEMFLAGNPFPSALDANDFINANSTTISGTCYFWEHWSEDTHVLREYQGGYATYNLSGGNRAIAHVDIDPGGTARVTPRRYVPIGLGFMVFGDADGGDVVFNNNQRDFMMETGNDGAGGSNFLRGENKGYLPQRIRLDLRLTNDIERPILIAFVDGATEDLDYGYEAEIKVDLDSDAYMIQKGKKLGTQGFGLFDTDLEIPFEVIVSEEDTGKKQGFKINELENIAIETKLYIKDSYTNKYHDLRNGLFEIELPAGEYSDRFSLVFKREGDEEEVLSISDETISHDILVYVNNSTSSIEIKNDSNKTLTKVALYNQLGQVINVWEKNLVQSNVSLPVSLSSGVYLVNVSTDKGDFTQKIIVE